MIHIKSDYYIDADETQFILVKDEGKTDKNGKRIRDNIGYYPTFAQAVKGYCKMAQRKTVAFGPDMELMDALFTFEAIVSEMEDLLAKTEVK